MAKSTAAFGTWAAPIGVTIAAIVALIVGLPLYLSATVRPVHPEPGSAPSVTQSNPSPAWSPAVDRARQAMRAALAEQNVPGLSVAVGAGGDIVWAEGFGWADIEARVPVTPATAFRIGTASTVLTSAAVGVLLDGGRLNLDDAVHRYVPEFPATQWPVTLRQLMGHTAGVGSDSGEDPLFRHRCEQPVQAFAHLTGQELQFEPGTQYRHSTHGWIGVSAAIEAVADQPFLAFMREEVFQPLGMTRTGAESATEENPEGVGEPGEDAPPLTLIRNLILEPLGIVERRTSPPDRATFYAPGMGPDIIVRHGVHTMRLGNMSCYAGAMAFLSTPSDLVRLGLALDSGRLLQPATVQALLTPQQLRSGQETGYGLGWDLETVTVSGKPTRSVGHDGELLGRRVMSFMMLPEHGVVVAVAANVSYADTSALALKVAEAFASQ